VDHADGSARSSRQVETCRATTLTKVEMWDEVITDVIEQ